MFHKNTHNILHWAIACDKSSSTKTWTMTFFTCHMLDLSSNIVLRSYTLLNHIGSPMGSAWIGMLPAIWDGMMFSGILPKVMISNLDCIQEIMSWFIMHKVCIPTTTCSRVSSVFSPCVGAGQSHCRTWQCQMLEDRQTFLQFPGDANIVVETKQITMWSELSQLHIL